MFESEKYSISLWYCNECSDSSLIYVHFPQSYCTPWNSNRGQPSGEMAMGRPGSLFATTAQQRANLRHAKRWQKLNNYGPQFSTAKMTFSSAFHGTAMRWKQKLIFIKLCLVIHHQFGRRHQFTHVIRLILRPNEKGRRQFLLGTAAFEYWGILRKCLHFAAFLIILTHGTKFHASWKIVGGKNNRHIARHTQSGNPRRHAGYYHVHVRWAVARGYLKTTTSCICINNKQLILKNNRWQQPSPG